MWLLDDDVITALGVRITSDEAMILNDEFEQFAQEQLKKVVEEGEKPCPHIPPGLHFRKDCPLCWTELRKEAGLEAEDE